MQKSFATLPQGMYAALCSQDRLSFVYILYALLGGWASTALIGKHINCLWQWMVLQLILIMCVMMYIEYMFGWRLWYNTKIAYSDIICLHEQSRQQNLFNSIVTPWSYYYSVQMFQYWYTWKSCTWWGCIAASQCMLSIYNYGQWHDEYGGT